MTGRVVPLQRAKGRPVGGRSLDDLLAEAAASDDGNEVQALIAQIIDGLVQDRQAIRLPLRPSSEEQAIRVAVALEGQLARIRELAAQAALVDHPEIRRWAGLLLQVLDGDLDPPAA